MSPRHPSALEIRPIEDSDRDRLAAAFAALSPEARYQRFHGPKPRLSSKELDQLTQLDHVTRDAVVAIEPATGRLVGVARYAVWPADASTAEAAIVVADDWQGRGLGLALSTVLVCRAAARGFARLTATALHDNARSRALLRRLGFRPRSREGSVVEFALELGATRESMTLGATA
ncbi:MAG: N-acetyltransferase family protein [Solirubrobacteraceae bacterium]